MNIWKQLNSVYVFITGWGTIHFGGPVAQVLQEVRIPVWVQKECEDAYKGKVFPKMMCAGLKTGGKDSCQVRNSSNC